MSDVPSDLIKCRNVYTPVHEFSCMLRSKMNGNSICVNRSWTTFINDLKRITMYLNEKLLRIVLSSAGMPRFPLKQMDDSSSMRPQKCCSL